ncbi:MarR family transcriptional regulator [Candidatus Woesearchaeota archaeon]|nr:MarR family transcriptional regulator [Candidatus Woesearchaeota archaeon]
MKNRTVGLLIIGIAVLIGFIVYLFNRALTDIVNASCTHGSECPMWQTLDVQTNIGIVIMVFVIIGGIYLVLWGDKESFDKKPRKALPKDLSNDEKLIMAALASSDGTIFQSDLVEKTNMSKVKVTRLLDRLEGKGLIERKRRGMTNVVVLKH